MKFSDVIGHDKIINSWRESFENERLPHALLLLGKEGSGKLSLAMSYVQRIFCQNPDSNQDACEVCNQCIKVKKLSHPDINFSFPYDDAKLTAADYGQLWRETIIDRKGYFDMRTWMSLLGSPKKTGNIPTKEVNRIIESLQLHSYEGNQKVHIIWRADYLGKEGNKLLKLIEEPPKDTFLILVAPSEEDILPTIISRCQTYYVAPYTIPDIAKILNDEFAINQDKAAEFSKLSQGDVNQAVQLTRAEGSSIPDNLLPWLRNCYIGNLAALVEWSDEMNQRPKTEQIYFLTYCLYFLRQLPYLQFNLKSLVYLSEKEFESATRLAKLIDTDKIGNMQRILDQSTYALERNAHQKLLFLTVSLRISKEFRKGI